MNCERSYRAMLRLFPGDYRAFFEAEMADAFARACQEQRMRGRFAALRFTAWELAGMPINAAREWVAKLTTNPWVRARSLPDLRLMRPAGVPRGVWFAHASDEIVEAEQRVEFCLRRMEHAIANHDFPGARFYSNEDLKARENLRKLKARRGLAE
jgi:hypothetical protein